MCGATALTTMHRLLASGGVQCAVNRGRVMRHIALVPGMRGPVQDGSTHQMLAVHSMRLDITVLASDSCSHHSRCVPCLRASSFTGALSMWPRKSKERGRWNATGGVTCDERKPMSCSKMQQRLHAKRCTPNIRCGSHDACSFVTKIMTHPHVGQNNSRRCHMHGS